MQMMMPISNSFTNMFRITVVDLPGFGGSDEPKKALTIEDYADILNKLFIKLRIKDPILIGHSFGGRVSIVYAGKYKVKKLILLSSPFKNTNKGNDFKTKVLKFLKKIPIINKLEPWAKNRFGSSDYRNASPIMKEVLVNAVNNDLTDYAKTADVNTTLESYAKTTVTDDLATKIAANTTAIGKKADATVIETLSGKVDKNTGDITALTEVVKDKASQADLTALTTTVEGHTADLTTLTQTVAGKADASTVTELTGKVTKNTNDIATLTTKVDGKVDKVTSEVNGEQVAWTLLSPTNKEKLDNLVLNEDGSVGISGTVAAEKVTGLADWVTGKRDSTPGLLSAADETKLDGIAEGAQVNVIEAIKLAGQTENLAITNKVVELPFATGEVAGIVKTSAEIGLDTNNALEVKSLNVNKLIQTEDVLLNCGGAAAFTYNK